MKKLLFFAACAALCASCTPKKPFTLAGTADSSADGQTVYLYDYQEGRAVDSTVVAEGRFSFGGRIAGDVLRRVSLGRNFVNVILEGGDFTVDLTEHTVGGSEKNEQLNRFNTQYDSIGRAFYENFMTLKGDALLSEAEFEAKADALVAETNVALGDLARPLVEANNNALGAYAFLRWSSDLETPEEFDAALALAGDRVREFAPVKAIVDKHNALKKTAEGMPFADFTIENLSLIHI